MLDICIKSDTIYSMKNMYDYVNYIEVEKTPEDLNKEFIEDFIKFRKENNLTQELLGPSVTNLLQILGPLGYTIKIEKVKKGEEKTTNYY